MKNKTNFHDSAQRPKVLRDKDMPYSAKKDEFDYEKEIEAGVDEYIDQFGDAQISNTERATGMQ